MGVVFLGKRRSSAVLARVYTSAMPPGADVAALVDGVLAELNEAVRARCDRGTILAKLVDVGCASSATDVRQMLDADEAGLKTELNKVAPPFFFAKFKLAVASGDASADAGPGHAASPTAPVQGSAGSLGVGPVSGTLAVKLGRETVVKTHSFTATASDTFESISATAVDKYAAHRAEELAKLPASVRTYNTPLLLSNASSIAEMGDAIGAAISLGYRFIVVVHEPSTAPAPPSSTCAFQRMMSSNLVLPDLYTAGEGQQLTYERSLYNMIVEHCQSEQLGVAATDKESCRKLILAVRDGVQIMAGRTGQFEYGSVPERFKSYGLNKAKKATVQLKSGTVQGYCDRLRGAIDRYMFTKSPMWSGFVSDANELHGVLLTKVGAMQGAAASQAERQERPCVRTAELGAQVHAAASPPPPALSHAHPTLRRRWRRASRAPSRGTFRSRRCWPRSPSTSSSSSPRR